MGAVIGIRPAKPGLLAVDDATSLEPAVWSDCWRRAASLLSDENRAAPDAGAATAYGV